MATATAILNTKYASKEGLYPIVIRLIDGKNQKLYPVKYKVREKQWNGEVVNHPDADIINSVIEDMLVKAKRYFRDCRLQETPIDLALVFAGVKSHSFTDYLRHRAKQHKAADQIEMEFKLNRYVKELLHCFGREIYFSDITQDFLREFDTYLKRQGNVNNTRSKKFEFMGKYYGNAITEGKAKEPNPFKIYKIKRTPVKKDKLTLGELKAIQELKLKDGTLRFARDLFLFAYYCKGARFETCLTMKKSAIHGDRLQFQANKGLKYMSVQIHPKLKAIIAHYIKNDTDYIFGKLTTDLADVSARQKRSKLGSENVMINRALKDVAAMAGIKIPLSMHHARHSLAFHLKQSSGNIGAIQDILGHSRSSVTENYLKSLDDEYLDDVLKGVYGDDL